MAAAYADEDALRGAARLLYDSDFAGLQRLCVSFDRSRPDAAICALVHFESAYCWGSVLTGGTKSYLPAEGTGGTRQLSPCPSVERVLVARGIDYTKAGA